MSANPYTNARVLSDTVRTMAREGLTSREIAQQTGLSKGSVYNICHLGRTLSDRRAAQAAEVFGPQVASGGYYTTVPDQSGRLVTLEGINFKERCKLIDYQAELRKMAQGKPCDLSPFAGKYVKVRNPGGKGAVRWYFPTNEKLLKRLAESGAAEKYKSNSPLSPARYERREEEE